MNYKIVYINQLLIYSNSNFSDVISTKPSSQNLLSNEWWITLHRLQLFPLLSIISFQAQYLKTFPNNKLRTSQYIPVPQPLLTHWGRVTHICVGKQTIIGSDNGLSPGRRQAIIWTNAGILLIGPLGTNFSEISIKSLAFSFTKMRLKVSSAKWHPFCLGLNVLTHWGWVTHICISKLSIVGSDNGLLPGWCQAIIWTNDWIMLIGPLRTNLSEILIKICTFSFKKMHFKMSSGK